jgi:hypothetical protein
MRDEWDFEFEATDELKLFCFKTGLGRRGVW